MRVTNGRTFQEQKQKERLEAQRKAAVNADNIEAVPLVSASDGEGNRRPSPGRRS